MIVNKTLRIFSDRTGAALNKGNYIEEQFYDPGQAFLSYTVSPALIAIDISVLTAYIFLNITRLPIGFIGT